MAPAVSRQSLILPDEMESAVRDALSGWTASDGSRRLWDRDPTLWTNAGEDGWLGWLDVTRDHRERSSRLSVLAAEVRGEVERGSLESVLLLGMGGSSLCPEVLQVTFGEIDGFPRLRILDSTDPAEVRSREDAIDPARTLFIVSSKSGTTLEPNILMDYFLDRARKAVGAAAGGRFIAITDPGSRLQQVAEREGFRHVFFGIPGIGGRYSALSDFGMVPAAVMGIEAGRFLESSDRMARACAAEVPARDNPGVVLGAVMGALHGLGRDKLTILSSPLLEGLGAWLEQLLAESTGKSGMGLIPVDRERPAAPDAYGPDRLFVHLRHGKDAGRSLDASIDALAAGGHPVVRIEIESVEDLGQEFFRWELATAVTGSILGINPFDQPDVEASKVATRQLTEEYERTGSLPGEEPLLEAGGVILYADPRNARELNAAVRGESLEEYLGAHLARLGEGDYFALLAYLERCAPSEERLQRLRHRVRDARKTATCLGFGPRFLHSTGQAYKGGPDSGVFLQITCDDEADLPVPGRGYTFGVVKAAQARGDLRVLAERGRRALRVHLGPDVGAGLTLLEAAVEAALSREEEA